MNDREKVNLIATMIADFWEFNEKEYLEKGALALVTAICSVVEFGERADG